MYVFLSAEYFGHTNKKCSSDSYVSLKKGQLKFFCVVVEKRNRCDFRKETPSLSLIRVFFCVRFFFFFQSDILIQ